MVSQALAALLLWYINCRNIGPRSTRPRSGSPLELGAMPSVWLVLLSPCVHKLGVL